MNNGIIVFSIDNYEHVENYRIIGKLQKVINKPIENFLILLNKIDKSENRENDLSTLNYKIMKYFPSQTIFKFTKNIILPLSTIQLENESKMSKDFKYFLDFHYINYINYHKKNQKTDAPIPQGLATTGGLNFINFLKDINIKQKIKKKNFVDIINKVVGDENYKKILKEIKEIITFIKERHSDNDLNLGIREDEFEENQIKSIIENQLQSEEDNEGENKEEENDGFDINGQDNVLFILFFYYDFKNQIPLQTKTTQTIKHYFTMQNMNNNIKK
jgi:hypothetical protein